MKIERENLLKEIEVLLKDEFVSQVTKTENEIRLVFLNGQEFFVQVNEVL